MAKVQGQTIPPELQTLWHALTSPGKLTQGADGTIQVKKNKKKPNDPPNPDKDLNAIRAIAELVADDHPEDWQTMGRPAFVLALIKQIILGNFDPNYFDEVIPDSVTWLKSSPYSILDPNPPPYGYRTQLFLPTVPTYPDGTVQSGVPGFFGEKEIDVFKDRWLKWPKLIFKPGVMTEPDALARMVMFWATDITITTSSRGSRPMLSLNGVCRMCDAIASTLASTKPPIEKITQFYWRFKMPPGGPPFYNATTGRRIVKPLATFARYEGIPPFAALVLNVSNRPMMGRGFNNNDTVETSFSDLPKIYEVPSCGPAKAAHWVPLTYAGANLPRRAAYRHDLKLWVVMCTTNALRSTDLNTWSAHYVWTNMLWRDICYAKGLGMFIAVGYTSSVGRIATCTLGYDWTIRTAPVGLEYTCCAYSDELGIAVVFGFGGAPALSFWSADGIAWNVGSSAWLQTCYQVIWVKELARFIAVGTAWSGQMGQTSTDGKNWSPMNISQPTNIVSVAWSPSLGYLVGVDDYAGTRRVAFSTDGASWTVEANGIAYPFNRIIWSHALKGFIAVSSSLDPNSLYFSATGHGWTPLAGFGTSDAGEIFFSKEACKHLTLNSSGTSPRMIQSSKDPA